MSLTEAEIYLFTVAIEEIKEKFDLQLEKTQELLERIECIDNSLDEIKDKDEILETIREFQRQFLRRI